MPTLVVPAKAKGTVCSSSTRPHPIILEDIYWNRDRPRSAASSESHLPFCECRWFCTQRRSRSPEWSRTHFRGGASTVSHLRRTHGSRQTDRKSTRLNSSHA